MAAEAAAVAEKLGHHRTMDVNLIINSITVVVLVARLLLLLHHCRGKKSGKKGKKGQKKMNAKSCGIEITKVNFGTYHSYRLERREKDKMAARVYKRSVRRKMVAWLLPNGLILATFTRLEAEIMIARGNLWPFFSEPAKKKRLCDSRGGYTLVLRVIFAYLAAKAVRSR